MSVTRLSTLLIALSVGAAGLATATPDPPATAAAVRSVEITGAGVSTYPAYSESIGRYGLRTTAATAGRIEVRANASPGSTVLVDGVPVEIGVAHTVSGLTAGDEVNVQITSGGTTTTQSWIYLPLGFPEIETRSVGAGPTPGHAALTLREGTGDSFASVVDTHGVPVAALQFDTLSADLAAQPNGHWSVAVAQTEDLWGDYTIEEYDSQFRKVATHRMVGHPRTDFHDAILLPGGGRILMAYVQASDGQTDSWVQEVSPTGEVLLDWNSRDHVDMVTDPVTNALGDYAHLNSIQVMADGNLLLSFRHLNQVMKIHRTTGAVMWRLGGRRSDFTFDDDPLGGPCLQHTARELANGDIQIFDNGSGSGPVPSAAGCPTPGSSDLVYRPRSRTTVYRLDAASGQAHLVRSYDAGAFSQFAGSAQRLGAGTLDEGLFVGLNNAEQVSPPAYPGWDAPDAVEFDKDGTVVWTLTSPGPATYRATKVAAPDTTPPTIASPVDGSVVSPGHSSTVAYSCHDTGGSNLAECSGPPQGAALAQTPGTHHFVVRALDAAGNVADRTVTYTVRSPAVDPPARPRASADAMIRKPGGAWKGKGTGLLRAQTVRRHARVGTKVLTRFKVRNRGDGAGRLRLRAMTRRAPAGRWYVGRREVTRRIVAGTYRTPKLKPGRVIRLRLVTALRPRDRRRPVVVRLRAHGPDGERDTVRLIVRAR